MKKDFEKGLLTSLNENNGVLLMQNISENFDYEYNPTVHEGMVVQIFTPEGVLKDIFHNASPFFVIGKENLEILENKDKDGDLAEIIKSFKTPVDRKDVMIKPEDNKISTVQKYVKRNLAYFSLVTKVFFEENLVAPIVEDMEKKGDITDIIQNLKLQFLLTDVLSDSIEIKQMFFNRGCLCIDFIIKIETVNKKIGQTFIGMEEGSSPIIPFEIQIGGFATKDQIETMFKVDEKLTDDSKYNYQLIEGNCLCSKCRAEREENKDSLDTMLEELNIGKSE